MFFFWEKHSKEEKKDILKRKYHDVKVANWTWASGEILDNEREIIKTQTESERANQLGFDNAIDEMISQSLGFGISEILSNFLSK